MVRNGRLATSQHAVKSQAQTSPSLSWRRIASRVGSAARLEQEHVGVGLALHRRDCIDNVYIVKYQYSSMHRRCHTATTRRPGAHIAHALCQEAR